MSLGVIEGFYGETWGWQARSEALPFLAQAGFTFFIYAPKSDRRLRREWRQAHDPRDAKELRDFGAACRAAGIGFGVGLTPLALHEEWSGEGRKALEQRLESLRSLRLDWLGVLFDDMRGDMPGLAQTQADIVKVVADAGVAPRLMMCPTYYSDASILDRLFGDRPSGYLRELGRAMDNAVGICWTGEQVVSETYTAAHLDRVADEMGQKPLIWDNYPVNDGPRRGADDEPDEPELAEPDPDARRRGEPPGTGERQQRRGHCPGDPSAASRGPRRAALRGLADLPGGRHGAAGCPGAGRAAGGLCRL